MISINYENFEVLHTTVFWAMTPCSFVRRHKGFAETYCLHFHDLKPKEWGNVFLQKASA
jgi:hypothetical protein